MRPDPVDSDGAKHLSNGQVLNRRVDVANLLGDRELAALPHSDDWVRNYLDSALRAVGVGCWTSLPFFLVAFVAANSSHCF